MLPSFKEASFFLHDYEAAYINDGVTRLGNFYKFLATFWWHYWLFLITSLLCKKCVATFGQFLGELGNFLFHHVVTLINERIFMFGVRLQPILIIITIGRSESLQLILVGSSSEAKLAPGSTYIVNHHYCAINKLRCNECFLTYGPITASFLFIFVLFWFQYQFQ